MGPRHLNPPRTRDWPLAAALMLAAGLGACVRSPVAAPSPTEIPATVAPAAQPSPTALVAATETSGPDFEAATYTNTAAGFAFDYPAGWTVGPDEQQSRAGITAFTSWARPADAMPGETPPGETRLDSTVQLWEPTGDLEAFLAQRRGAWDGSGIRIVSQEDWTLDDGRPAAGFVVEGSDGAQGYFFLTTIGDKYLVLSGSGDLALLAAIAHTVRPLPTGS